MKTDTQLHKDVIEEIQCEPSTTAAQNGVTSKDGVVTLIGTVATDGEKWAAQNAAQRVEVFKGLAEEIMIKTCGEHPKTGTEIAEAAVNSLKWHVWL